MILGCKKDDQMKAELESEKAMLVTVGPVTRAKAMKFKEALNGLIQDILDKKSIERSIWDDTYQIQPIISLIQVQ